MEITIKETGETEELELIDPKTGCSWIMDLLGNHNADMDHDEDNDIYTMDQKEFDWWDSLIDRYQAADDKSHEMLSELTGEAWESLTEAIQNVDGSDLEDYPERLTETLEEWVKLERENTWEGNAGANLENSQGWILSIADVVYGEHTILPGRPEANSVKEIVKEYLATYDFADSTDPADILVTVYHDGVEYSNYTCLLTADHEIDEL